MELSTYNSVIEALQEGVYAVDSERQILTWNHGAEELTGYAGSSVVGTKCSDGLLRHVTADGCELCTKGCPLQATMHDGITREAEVYFHHKEGHRVPAIVKAIPLYSARGELTGAIEVFYIKNDSVSLLRQIEAMKHDTLTDPLTGLGNRRYLEEMAALHLPSAGHGTQEKSLGLLMIDIDHFKQVNDTYGHLVGDRTLQMVAHTLSGGLRPLDKIARYGGEEFVVLCPGTTAAELADIAERLRLLVGFSWLDMEDKSQLSATVSVGGAVSHEEDDLASMLGRADEAMYECKKSGRNRILVR